MDFDKIYESCKLKENAVAMTPDQLKNYFTLMFYIINYTVYLLTFLHLY